VIPLHDDEPVALPLEEFEFELGARAFNALRSAGLSTLGEVAAYSPDELRTIRNLGSKSMARIAATLERRGLSQRQNEAQPSSSHTTALDARTADIVARRTAGETLAVIADAYGITRERVRQILNRIGFDPQACPRSRKNPHFCL
jgi:nucleotidyltransferase/DNA polymerase involved in DNA repair